MRNEKRKTTKKIAVAACAALAIACAWTGGSIGLKGAANAEETTTRGASEFENDGAFYAITGASVKLHSVTGDDSADYNGIRFSFEMSEAQYALIAGTQNGTATFNEGVTVGAYVVPVSQLNLGEGETPDAAKIAAAGNAEHKEISADKWTKAASDAQADTQVYKSYLYVYDIPTENMDSDLACYAYLKSGENELKTAVQVRSMQYVAKASVDAGEHTAAELERYLPEQSVTFKADGLADNVKKVKYGASVEKPAASPVKDGYTFLNWVDKDGKTYDFSAAVKENITLTANFHENKYGVIDFSNYNELVQTDSVRLTYENTENSGKIIDINGEKAVSVKSNSKGPAAVVTGEKIKTCANFDYITAKVKYTVPSGSYVQVFMRGRYSDAPYTAATTSASDGWTFATIQTNLAQMKDLSTNGMVLWLYSPSEGLVGTDYIISEIRGGYNGITIEENPVDLTEKFGLAQNEFSATFTDIDGNGSAVADVTNFNSNVAGTLAVTVNKAGYSASTFSVSVKMLSEYDKIDFNQIALNAKPFNVTTNGTNGIAVVEEDGYKAVKTTIAGAYPHVYIKDDKVKELANFDFITLRVKIVYSTSGGTVGLKGTSGDVYNGASSTKTDGKWTLMTWRKDHVKTNGTLQGQNIFNYLKNNGIFDLSIYAWAKENTTITIAEITGGYDDISTSETPLDLTKKLGLAASDFTATFTPENGVEQAVENVAAVNISAAGTLKITVKKSGYAATVLTIGVKAAS